MVRILEHVWCDLCISANKRCVQQDTGRQSRADADDGGFGVASVAQPIAKARANGHDVLQRAAELHACHVRVCARARVCVASATVGQAWVQVAAPTDGILRQTDEEGGGVERFLSTATTSE